MDIHCPMCRQTIRLPGQLDSFATIQRRRQSDRLSVGLEALGFLCMFFYFPWGLLVGAVVVFQGWRKSNAFLCSNCKARVPKATLEKCPKCQAKFGSE